MPTSRRRTAKCDGDYFGQQLWRVLVHRRNRGCLFAQLPRVGVRAEFDQLSERGSQPHSRARVHYQARRALRRGRRLSVGRETRVEAMGEALVSRSSKPKRIRWADWWPVRWRVLYWLIA